MDGNQRAPLTDSPWFWALLFSLMGLVALAAMAGKYSRRQANIERNYQARSRVAETLTAENNPDAGERIESPDAQRSYATPDDKLIPIWPLAVLLGLVSAVAGGMLYRGRVARNRVSP